MQCNNIATKRGNDGNSQLCFFTAAVLFIAGMVGYVANYIAPDSTNLDALLIVGLFYLGLAVIDLRVTARLRARESAESDERSAKSGCNRAA